MAQIERKLGKLKCGSNPSEDPNIKKQKSKQAKRTMQKPSRKTKTFKNEK